MVGTGGNAGNGGKPRLVGTEASLHFFQQLIFEKLFFQEAAVMIVTVSLIVGAVLAILGYLAKKYGKCKWLAACISAREVDAENQKVQKNQARKS